MKKLVAMVFAIVLGCASLSLVAGCGGGGGGGADYSGHWSISAIESGGQQVAMSDLEAYGYSADDLMSIDLNADGTAKFNIGSLVTSFMGDAADQAMGILDAANITWAASANGVDLTANGQTMTLAADGADLVFEQSGTKLIFSKS